MDALGSPSESLLLSSYSLTTLSSFCTCVAVLTAAVSLWRIRAVGSLSRPKSILTPSSPDRTDEKDAAAIQKPPAPREPSDLTPSTSSRCEPALSAGADGVRRRKFTAYYEEAGIGDEGVDDVSDAVCSVGGGFDQVRIRLPVTRTVDLGWYWGQDLTVLNGSVVRLWDREGRRMTPLRWG
ncbi:uncharacterized protein LOC131252185 [Magnolia sinica]|uniref:uncharacterized protein LOC131252185 n=1 Tax=Magnolia sinica TaxID=86752 RepID=UPI002658F687|nr:uncharacterized protein LOC131252185 [Magnolia sinica]